MEFFFCFVIIDFMVLEMEIEMFFGVGGEYEFDFGNLLVVYYCDFVIFFNGIVMFE